MARRKKHHSKHRRKHRGMGKILSKQTITMWIALGAGAIAARLANKKLPEVIGQYSSSLGTFAAYATPAALIALALLVKKMARGGQFVTLASNVAIGEAIADAFTQAFPNVIEGLGGNQMLQGRGDYQYQVNEGGRAIPFPNALQGIPNISSYTRESGDYRQRAY